MPSLGTSFGRGGATTFQQDLQNADCIVIQGSNMAECHPVGFQWVMEAKARGATVIHVDPRFTRTSALADQHVPLRAGSDIAFLGGIVNYILTNEKYFRDYVVSYTNAAAMVDEDFRDADDLGGLFSGYDPASGTYDNSSWAYQRAPEPAAGVGGVDDLGSHDKTSGWGDEFGSHGDKLHGVPTSLTRHCSTPVPSSKC